MADVPDRGPVAGVTPDLSGAARAAMEVIAGAERPLVVVGGPQWSAQAARDLARFAEVQGLPVAVGFRRQDYLDNRHPHYAGDLNVGVNPRLAKRLREADALLVIGSRLGDIETQGYTLLSPEGHGKRLVHVHPDADEPGRVWATDLAVTAQAPDFVAALAGLNAFGPGWPEAVTAARADYDWWKTPVESPGAVKQEEVIRWLSDNLPEDAILTNGAGNYAAWLHRYFVYKGFRTQLAPTSGSMGYGFPAAVSASLEHPGKTVVCLAGDGCFQMTLNELSTAVQHGAKPIVIVVNNGRYGTIRMHQEKHYPGRVSGTMLANPDFAALAKAYGGHGEVVRDGVEFPAAFARAKAAGTVAVIELVVDEEALSTGQTLSAARAAGLAAKG